MSDTPNNTYLLYDEGEEIFSDPYQVIAVFFDICSLASHRKYITTWLKAVNTNDYWQESSPSDLIFYYNKLIVLIKAAHQIYQDKQQTTAIGLLRKKGYNVEANLLHPALYVGRERDHTLWNYLPRCLNLKEYNNPYLVFPKFFALYNLEEWLLTLRELLSDGLSTDNAAALGNIRNMLLIETRLLKLVEALHLIDVREVEFVRDFRKRNRYTLSTPCEEIDPAPLLRIMLNDKNHPLSIEDSEWKEKEEENFEEKRGNEDEESMDDEGENEEYEEDDKVSGQQDRPFIELIIRGSYQTGDHRSPLEAVKINIPVK